MNYNLKQISNIKIIITCLVLAVSLSNCKVKKPITSTTTSTNAAVTKLPRRTLMFSGYEWVIKNPTGKMGPHANYWNGDNVWVDKKGRLHFTIKYNKTNDRWECSEVATIEKFGNGTYQWKIEGPVNALDRNIVFGLFNYSGRSTLDEMDIEFSRWGYPNAPILNYTIWPAEKGGVKNVTYAKDFEMKDKKMQTTHRWIRSSDKLVFESMHGFQDGRDNLFETKTWTSENASISKLDMPVLMNLWLFNNPPTDKKDVELIVHEFKFIKH